MADPLPATGPETSAAIVAGSPTRLACPICHGSGDVTWPSREAAGAVMPCPCGIRGSTNAAYHAQIVAAVVIDLLAVAGCWLAMP